MSYGSPKRSSEAIPRRNVDPLQKAVGLGLHDVPQAHELRMVRESANLRLDVRRLQIDPADDASDERVLIGQRQQPARLLQRLADLDGDTRVESRTRPFPDARPLA